MNPESFLADYLRREGLTRNLLEEHKPNLPIPYIWLTALWVSAIFVIWREKGINGFLIALFVPVGLLIVSLIVLAIFYAIRNWKHNRELNSKDTLAIGGFFLFAFPIVVASFVGIYLRSWFMSLLYLLASFLGFVLIILIQYQQHRARMFFELIRSLFKAIRQSLALLIVLIPVLLVVVLLSVFSSELWDAIGNLDFPKLVIGISLMALPVILLVLGRLDTEVKRIVRGCPSAEELISDAAQIPYIREKLDNGFISEEEWSDVVEQLKWKNVTKLTEHVMPALQYWTKAWLIMLLLTTNILLIAVFFFYFLLIFRTLLDAEIIAVWMGIPVETLNVPLRIAEFSYEFGLDSTLLPTMQVALLLAVFVAMMSVVYALTEDSFKEQFTKWLSEKAYNWLAASSLYLSSIHPNYQIWEYTRDDKRSGMVNVSIVVPKDISEQEVRVACEHLDSQLKAYQQLVVITAFEQNQADPRYRTGIPGKRWRFIHNKIKEKQFFEETSLETDEVRYQDSLGHTGLQENEEIPDEWFGNSLQAVSLARKIWESDIHHGLILHPYGFEANLLLTLEIHLLKRLPNSNDYQQFIKELLPKIQDVYQTPHNRTILIDLCFRDTVDSLASFEWNQEHAYITYKDEYIGKSKMEKLKKWVIVK